MQLETTNILKDVGTIVLKKSICVDEGKNLEFLSCVWLLKDRINLFPIFQTRKLNAEFRDQLARTEQLSYRGSNFSDGDAFYSGVMKVLAYLGATIKDATKHREFKKDKDSCCKEIILGFDTAVIIWPEPENKK